MPVLGDAKVEEVGSVEETFGFLFFVCLFVFEQTSVTGHKEFTKKRGIALITMLHKCHFLGLGGNRKLEMRDGGICSHFSVMDIFLYFSGPPLPKL